MRIAEECFHAERLVESVVLSELGSVVEADSFSDSLRKLPKLASNGLSGTERFPIRQVLNDAKSGLPLVQDEQSLAISSEQHEVSLPMAWLLAVFDLGGSFGDWAPLFNEAGGAAA